MAFPTTRWTMIRRAIDSPSDLSKSAMDELCRMYAAPVLGFICRETGSREKAEDLTQEFFSRILEGRVIRHPDSARGRFRDYLLNAVRGFLLDARDYQNARRRGGGDPVVSLNRTYIEVVDTTTPDLEFEINWVRAVLNNAIQKLQAEYDSPERRRIFQILKEELDTGSQMPGREIAEQLKMSDVAVRVARNRMRSRLGKLIRQEVADTVSRPEDVDTELLIFKKTLEKMR